EAPSTHELEVNVIQSSVWRSTVALKYLTSSQISIVRRYVDDYKSGLFQPTATQTALQVLAPQLQDEIGKDAAAHGVVTGLTSGKAQADALLFFDLGAYYGQEDFNEYTNVYRRTMTAATPDQVRASFEGFGKIWTTKEVQLAENIDPT